MKTIEFYRLPRLIVSAGVLACALVAVPLALGSQPDGSPALKAVQASASEGGGDHDGDHDGGHDSDGGDRSEHSDRSEHGSYGHDSDDDGDRDGGDDRYPDEDRSS